MLFRTLHGKLAAILLALLCLAGCLAVPLVLLSTQRYRQEVDQNLDRSLAASLAAHLSELGLLGSDSPKSLAKARAEIKHLMIINPAIDVYLLDARGDVTAYSGIPDKVVRSRISLAPIRRFLAHDRLPILGDDPRSADQHKVFSVADYKPRGRGSPGYVYVILGGQRYDSTADLLGRSYILRSSLWGLATLFTVVGLTGLLLFRFLTLRLHRLTSAMDAFQADDFRQPGDIALLPSARGDNAQAQDEIDRLGRVFREMAERIDAQVERLNQSDRHLREMVSNVSHDLRTPLAAIQGYLETLLIKEGMMTPEEQRGYLQVASRQCQRLSALVSELFELAQLDSSEVQIHPEPFSLSELAQDIVLQHQLAAEQKKVRLVANLPKDLPFVSADIGLIERVLQNLLENALRYTPEGGTVTVNVAEHPADAVSVTVSDTGCGISPEDLPHIFERFYRASNQPDQYEPGSAGIGLAIAKRILELHASTIEVASIPNEGTSFTFHLPVASHMRQ